MEGQTITKSPNATDKLKTLFKTVLKKSDAKVPVDTQTVLTPATAPSDNWQNRRQGETYHNYGNRICGRVTASQYSFSAFLQRIFNIERQQQINNIALQDAYKNQIRNQISSIDGQVTTLTGQINALDVDQNRVQNSIGENKAELNDLIASNGEINRPAKIKLIFGGILLTLLTLYLFVFYSSTFYSAFFKDFIAAGSENVGAHMFDSQAIAASFAAGIGQLLFVLSAPIIFLGLGFSLHYFSKEKGYAKFLKIAVIIVVTFIFDCILAYSIAKNIHMIESMSTLESTSVYTIKEAISDSNVWAVIFCGFVVYLIWGIVFNLTMTAYEELRSNKSEQEKLKDKIQHLENKSTEIDIQKNDLNTQISNLNSKKNGLMLQLKNNSIIDDSPIKVAMNDFYAGWMSMMSNLGCSQEMQKEAAQIYSDNCNTLFAQTINN